MSDDIGYPAFLEGLDETGRVVARKEIQSADHLDGSHDLTSVVEPPFIVHAVRIRGTEQTIPINLNGPLDVWARFITARMNIRAPEDNARSWDQRRNKIKQIRQRHEQGERASADGDREWLLDEVERLTRKRDEARAEVERLTRNDADLRTALNALAREKTEALTEASWLRAERDTLLLDAREFVRWFGYHFIHVDDTATIAPLCALSERLQAHADTLAALDAAMAKTDKEGGR